MILRSSGGGSAARPARCSTTSRRSMPEDSPGSLPPEQYVDIVAYFLGMNGFRMGSAGTEVDEEGLQSLSLAPFSGN